MRITAVLVLIVCCCIAPAAAVDFLGVELCRGSIDTRVELPPGSSLVLESVEIGDHGGLVMLLSASNGKVMDHVDDLMTGLTGKRGEGDGDVLEWSDGRLTGVAQKVAKKYAALAVTSTDRCGGDELVETPGATTEATGAAPPAVEAEAPTPAPETAAVATVAVIEEPRPELAPTPSDFEVVGAISHEAADPTWVDVMGVVANHTEDGYRLATFDLSLYREDGSLICVDTISVSVLKSGQERAFRDAIRCPGYDTTSVARTELQFSGGF